MLSLCIEKQVHYTAQLSSQNRTTCVNVARSGQLKVMCQHFRGARIWQGLFRGANKVKGETTNIKVTKYCHFTVLIIMPSIVTHLCQYHNSIPCIQTIHQRKIFYVKHAAKLNLYPRIRCCGDVKTDRPTESLICFSTENEKSTYNCAPLIISNV